MAGNKGQFKKGNQAAKKKTYKSTLLQANAAEDITPLEEKDKSKIVYDYIPFGIDNLFPQRIAKLNRLSAISRSVISSKANYISGEGYETENQRFQNWMPNPNESLRLITNKLANDRLNSGNAYIEIVKVDNDINLFHKDHTKIRISKDGKNAILHPDWDNYLMRKKEAVVIPLFPEFALVDGHQRSIYHVRTYEQEFDYYGLPSNIAGYDSVNINYKTNKWNLSRLENSFKLSGILNVFANFSEEDAQTFEEGVNNKFSGESKQGKLMTIINEIGADSEPSTFTPIETNEDGNWIQLHEQATQEIVISNQWFLSLSGINTQNGFDVNRIRNDYQIALSGIIPNEQRVFTEAFTTILNTLLNFGLNDLEIKNVKPLNNIDLIDFTDTVSKNERRALMGLELVEEEDVKQSLNGAQVTSMVEVIRAVSAKEISKTAGIQILMTSYGLSEEQAKEFFK